MIVILFVLLVFNISTLKAEEADEEFPENFGKCKTPNAEEGYCVYLSKCEPLNATLTKVELSADEIALLKDSFCKREHDQVVVCCPSINNLVSVRTSFASQSDRLPRPGICGAISGDRIFLGDKTNIGDFPWTVLLGYVQDDKFSFVCGGSLIQEEYVLTAAHCFFSSTINVTTVRLGEHDINSNPDCYEGLCADPVLDILIHKVHIYENFRYGYRNRYHDIALVRLTNPTNYTRWIKPICLPQQDDLKNISDDIEGLDIAGWGRTERNHLSLVKLKAKVNTIKQSDCNVFYARSAVLLKDTQLCTLGEKNENSCEGDSGGPLTAQNRKSAVPYYYLMGVESFGPSRCGLRSYPSVYTRVSYYMDWIADKMLEDSLKSIDELIHEIFGKDK